RLSASLWSALASGSTLDPADRSAQRLSASLWSAPFLPRLKVPEAFLCSTPLGVTVVGTVLAAEPRAARVGVLNASRRHCGRHARRGRHVPAAIVCSTPLGVTVVG